MSPSGEEQARPNLNWWPPGTLPAQYSIVWCSFPYSKLPEKPGPKPRPALVFSARHVDDPPSDHFEVKVAYGTSNVKSNERPFDFTIINMGTLNVLRLYQHTRFDLDRVLWLPWAKPFFTVREGRGDAFTTPVVSVLPAGLQRELGWLMRDREELGMNGNFHAC